MRAGVYLRISRGDEDQTATVRQRQDCEAFVERHGWDLADVFEDVDLSAYDRRVRRPEYERLIEAVKGGQVDCVVAWHIDRLTRSLMPYARLMEACDDAKAFIVTVDGVDTRTSPGRFHADILVGHARMSSEDTSRRNKRKHEELARAGKLAGLGRRSYGYQFNQDTRQLEIIDEEAGEIQEAVRRILSDGAGVYTILKDWTRRGLQAPGGKWQQANFRRMITSARIAGQREYDGSFVDGSWPGIISVEQLVHVRRRLNGHGKRLPTARRYLLSGFLRCGLCGVMLRSRPDGHKRRYVCTKDDGGCGSLARIADPLEAMVRDAILIVLDGADLREYVEKPTDHTAELLEAIRSDEDQMRELATDFYGWKRISRAEFFSARDMLAGRIDSNRQKLSRQNGHGILNQLVNAGEQVRDMWSSKGLDWQRSVVGALIDHIVVNPAPRGERVFRPERVEIVWRF
jgi:site-specific DNA recombinase